MIPTTLTRWGFTGSGLADSGSASSTGGTTSQTWTWSGDTETAERDVTWEQQTAAGPDGWLLTEAAAGIAYSGPLELAALLLYLMLALLWILASNGFFLLTVAVHDQLHTKHFCLLSINAVNDIVVNLTFMPTALMILFSYTEYDTVIRVLCNIVISMVLVQTYMVIVIGFERYIYFKHPMKYTNLLSRRSMLIILVFVYAINFSISTASDVFISREVSITFLCTQFKRSGNVMSVVGVITNLIPSMLATVIIVIKLKMHIKEKQLAPASGPQQNQADTAANASLFRNMKVAVKLILLTTGMLWITTLPASLMRTLVFSLGYTWDDIETRRSTLVSLMIRSASIMYTTVSAALNPLVYFYISPELRQKACGLWARVRSRGTVNPAM